MVAQMMPMTQEYELGFIASFKETTFNNDTYDDALVTSSLRTSNFGFPSKSLDSFVALTEHSVVADLLHSNTNKRAVSQMIAWTTDPCTTRLTNS